jgi:hypothetical protein
MCYKLQQRFQHDGCVALAYDLIQWATRQRTIIGFCLVWTVATICLWLTDVDSVYTPLNFESPLYLNILSVGATAALAIAGLLSAGRLGTLLIPRGSYEKEDDCDAAYSMPFSCPPNSAAASHSSSRLPAKSRSSPRFGSGASTRQVFEIACLVLVLHAGAVRLLSAASVIYRTDYLWLWPPALPMRDSLLFQPFNLRDAMAVLPVVEEQRGGGSSTNEHSHGGRSGDDDTEHVIILQYFAPEEDATKPIALGGGMRQSDGSRRRSRGSLGDVGDWRVGMLRSTRAYAARHGTGFVDGAEWQRAGSEGSSGASDRSMAWDDVTRTDAATAYNASFQWRNWPLEGPLAGLPPPTPSMQDAAPWSRYQPPNWAKLALLASVLETLDRLRQHYHPHDDVDVAASGRPQSVPVPPARVRLLLGLDPRACEAAAAQDDGGVSRSESHDAVQHTEEEEASARRLAALLLAGRVWLLWLDDDALIIDHALSPTRILDAALGGRNRDSHGGSPALDAFAELQTLHGMLPPPPGAAAASEEHGRDADAGPAPPPVDWVFTAGHRESQRAWAGSTAVNAGMFFWRAARSTWPLLREAWLDTRFFALAPGPPPLHAPAAPHQHAAAGRDMRASGAMAASAAADEWSFGSESEQGALQERFVSAGAHPRLLLQATADGQLRRHAGSGRVTLGCAPRRVLTGVTLDDVRRAVFTATQQQQQQQNTASGSSGKRRTQNAWQDDTAADRPSVPLIYPTEAGTGVERASVSSSAEAESPLCTPIALARVRVFSLAGINSFPNSFDWRGPRSRVGDWIVHTAGDSFKHLRVPLYLAALWGRDGPPDPTPMQLCNRSRIVPRPLPEALMPEWTFWG